MIKYPQINKEMKHTLKKQEPVHLVALSRRVIRSSTKINGGECPLVLSFPNGVSKPNHNKTQSPKTNSPTKKNLTLTISVPSKFDQPKQGQTHSTKIGLVQA